jgi:hypothetical protein
MSQQKPHQFRPPLYHRHESPGSGTSALAPRSSESRVTSEESDRQGWEAYRRWLARAGEKAAPERSPLDHSIYSWRGYHNWADKVRQSWKPEKG